MARNFLQGYYIPENPEKCLNAGKITYRSSYELQVFKWLDRNPNILEWGSEIIQIPYVNSVKGRKARYFPDILVKYRNKNGDILTEVIEIKPYSETVKPKKGKNQKQSTYDYQVLTYIQNMEKWTAAKHYANERGWGFRILTENEIFR